MRKSEAAKLPLASSCHEVQGDVGRDGFEFVPDFVGDKVPSSLIDEVFQTNNESKRSPSNEVEEGELIEGIEANDVSALLEQFLEYEEKQGSMDCSTSLVSLQSSLKDTSTKVKTISDKINLSVEAQQLDFDFPLDARSGGLPCLDVEISEHSPFTTNGENQEVHDLARSGSSPDYVEGLDESSKCDKKCQVDNHATDHNYACSGFPMRKPLTLEPEVNDDSIKQSILTCSPKASSSSDQEQKNEKNFCNGTENNHSLKRRLSCDENATDRKRILPKRYRGPYCEGSSDGDSSCDEERRYRYISTDEESDHKRMLSNKKSDYSSDEDRNYRKRSHRRHSLYSNDSCDGREYSSSDEESKNERTSRYDPRRSESDWHHKQSSGSNRESDHCRSQRNRRRRRSRSSDCSEKRNDIIKNRKFHDIELERKMEFKFDHHIRDTAKEERRIVYIGKISNKTTKDDVFRRFRPFGPIEKVTVHFREKGDNYAFVTFFEYSSAAEAIERGNEDSRLPVLDLCFGGRRKFCGGSYVDFDSNTSYLEEQELSRPPSSDEMDFDALLRMSQKRIKTRKGSFKGR